jgi:hypothetical protein
LKDGSGAGAVARYVHGVIPREGVERLNLPTEQPSGVILVIPREGVESSIPLPLIKEIMVMK